VSITYCETCEGRLDLGEPSVARWAGPDGKKYCSMHFVNRFGHGEPLVLIEDYKPPTKRKKAAPKKKAAAKKPKSAPKKKVPKEVAS
jgi:hypothetical protein